MSASTALALVTVSPASAHLTEHGTPHATIYGPSVTQQAAFGALLGAQLDALQAKATALHAKAAAVPNSTVLAGRQRHLALSKLRFATALSAGLAQITGLTPTQAAQVQAIRAQLDAAAAELKALLANRPTGAAATRTDRVVKVVTVARTVSAADPSLFAGLCDHRGGTGFGAARFGAGFGADNHADGWRGGSGRHHR
jgi:hypothetical protein